MAPQGFGRVAHASRLGLARGEQEKTALGSAYTPGLTVSADTVVRRIRRLPIKGDVLVKVGDHVTYDQVVARALLPGMLQTVRLAEKLGVETKDAPSLSAFKIGDSMAKGDLIAQTKGFFGLGKQEIRSEYTGTVETLSEVTGNMLVREPSIPVDIAAYVTGVVVEVIPAEGAVIETRGAVIQGIFGIGGERNGELRIAVSSPHDLLDEAAIRDSDSGKILVGGRGVTAGALKKANDLKVAGLLAGAVKDVDLIAFLGYDIGVAITGQEQIETTLLCTEGFGELPMAERTFNLLKSIEGRRASMNGATQIRAGVIRPEVVAPSESQAAPVQKDADAQTLGPGTPIRVIREPYFGRIGSVTELPAQLQVVESGAEVRVLKAVLDDGQEVMVPRANVEIIATA